RKKRSRQRRERLRGKLSAPNASFRTPFIVTVLTCASPSVPEDDGSHPQQNELGVLSSGLDATSVICRLLNVANDRHGRNTCLSHRRCHGICVRGAGARCFGSGRAHLLEATVANSDWSPFVERPSPVVLEDLALAVVL